MTVIGFCIFPSFVLCFNHQKQNLTRAVIICIYHVFEYLFSFLRLTNKRKNKTDHDHQQGHCHHQKQPRLKRGTSTKETNFLWKKKNKNKTGAKHKCGIWLLWCFFTQAALVICSFAIGGFDYSRTRKQGKTANNKGKKQF